MIRSASQLLLLALAVGACSRDRADYAGARERLKDHIVEKVPAGVTPLDVVFGEKLKLVGYKLEPPPPLKRKRRQSLTLYWRSEGPVSPDHRLVTHVLDEAGKSILDVDDSGPLRERKDGKPALPPAAWKPNEVYVDDQSFRLPRTPVGKVQIVVEVTNGHERMKVTKGAHESNRALIVSADVGRPPRKASPARVPSAGAERLDPSVKITIDGKLDEPVWKTVPALGFVDVTTGEANRTFPVDGSVRLLWNELGFYAGFEIRDPDVVGGFDKSAKDPHLWTRDAVEIMVDPDGDGDNQDYYEIQISPQNLVFDSRFDRYNEPKTEPNGPFGHEDWSSGVKSAVRVAGTLDKKEDRDQGYVVEALVPWKAFDRAKKSPPNPGDVWRLNFYAMQENSGVAWSPILGQGNFHKAERFGRVSWAEPGGNAASASATDAGVQRGASDLARRLRSPSLRAVIPPPRPHFTREK